MSIVRQLIRVAEFLVRSDVKMRKVKRGGTTLRFPSSGGFVGEYISYIAHGILCALSVSQQIRSIRIVFSRDQVNSWSSLVFVNLEHTLVRQGGRGSAGSKFGAVDLENSTGEKYLVRLDGDKRLWDRSRVVIDYSMPNIANVASSSSYSHVSNKTVYLAPCLGKASTGDDFRNRDYSRIFTIMSITDRSDRRLAIVKRLERETGVSITNLDGVKSSNDPRLAKIGLLLNLHQTRDHHTLEELRLLPILRQRALILSETSPLLNLVSYRDFLDFAPEEALGAAIRKILAKREEIWHERFTGDRFSQVMEDLEKHNESAFKQIAQLTFASSPEEKSE